MDTFEKKLDETILYSKKKSINFTPTQEIPKGPNPLKLSKWCANEISTFNNEIDKIESECAIQCTCTKSCSACCNQLIVLSSSEFLALQPALDNIVGPIKKLLLEKTKQQCAVLENNNITNSSVTFAHSIERQQKIQEAYFNLNIPCPLLNENKECIVYPVRPTNCWTYRNYGDKSDCEASHSVPYSIKYDDWEEPYLKRLFNAKKPNKIAVLQFMLKDFFKI